MRGDDDQPDLPADQAAVLPMRTPRLAVQHEAVRLKDRDEGGEIQAG